MPRDGGQRLPTLQNDLRPFYGVCRWGTARTTNLFHLPIRVTPIPITHHFCVHFSDRLAAGFLERERVSNFLLKPPFALG